MDDELLTVTQAAEYLSVPRIKIYRLLKKGMLSAYSNPMDERQKLIKKSQLDELKKSDRQRQVELLAA